jgi:ferredoxin
MILRIDKNECDQCGACVGVCPGNALVLTEEIKVMPERCIACGRCVTLCPHGACSIRTEETRNG